MFTITFRSVVLEVSASSLYIRIGSFERFYNTDGLPSH